VLRNKIFTLNDAGVLTCGSSSDGARLWQLRLKGPFSATPVAAESYLYCVSENGVLQVVDTNAKEGAIAGTFDLKATVLSTPSIAHGGLYVRSDGTLWKLTKG
jgi:outer membrane protein assembly factor BamB